ncbi:tRNA pseudouridine(55) synthase TruB [Lipingzhangella sp. LS1_29]|uniref:tRNA pseudouridine synthase B n=1 Tax=Lipingzhangella rawalii TaxID=2055835 RepID=A0ABU2H5I4_9ACTN|nr:tRNA pseudouridine(55) synthase TruB [Lipingzhangella rawalii]MDS1270568.1 tRNA pseudouridine(55) synthase TruB [Lipingzhangella rawalii]
MTRSDNQPGQPAAHGLVVVDKPAGMTSHDVVARMRRIAGTRKIGHAGTLDPMATGVLVLGVGKGTKLLGHLTLTEKAYAATMRLGQHTSTDDAEGELLGATAAGHLTETEIRSAALGFTGEIQQVPPQVSAVKVDGKRAYASARAGHEVKLEARSVTVTEFTVTDVRSPSVDAPHGAGAPQPAASPAEADTGIGADTAQACVDVDLLVRCSSGTYVRSLARDLGVSLGVGGHLTALRRTRVGPYDLDQARTLEELAEECTIVPLAAAVDAAFPRRDLSGEQARRIAHGNRIPSADMGSSPVGLFDPTGQVVALGEERQDHTKPIVVFVQ